jgi:hypothetical protein
MIKDEIAVFEKPFYYVILYSIIMVLFTVAAIALYPNERFVFFIIGVGLCVYYLYQCIFTPLIIIRKEAIVIRVIFGLYMRKIVINQKNIGKINISNRKISFMAGNKANHLRMFNLRVSDRELLKSFFSRLQ